MNIILGDNTRKSPRARTSRDCLVRGVGSVHCLRVGSAVRPALHTQWWRWRCCCYCRFCHCCGLVVTPRSRLLCSAACVLFGAAWCWHTCRCTLQTHTNTCTHACFCLLLLGLAEGKAKERKARERKGRTPHAVLQSVIKPRPSSCRPVVVSCVLRDSCFIVVNKPSLLFTGP